MAVPPTPAEATASEPAVQRPTGPGQQSTGSLRPPDPEEVPGRVAAGTDNVPRVHEHPDPRIKEAMAESRKQAREAHAADHAAAVVDGLPDERIREPMKGAPDEVKALLGDSAKMSGNVRMVSQDGRAGERLQAEWVAGNKAAWFDVPRVTVETLADPQPPSPDVWPTVPGSRPAR